MKQNIRTFLAAALAVLGLAVRGGEFTYVWKTTTAPVTLPNSETEVLKNVMAYLIDADKLDQQTLLTRFFEDAGQTPFGTLVNENGARLSSAHTTKEGYVEASMTFSPPSEGTDGHAYFALMTFQDEESLLYFSGYSTIKSSSWSGDGELVLDAASSHGDINRTTTFVGSMTAGDGGGWYAAPEPTSGVLMLLGIAALALRRRRA